MGEGSNWNTRRKFENTEKILLILFLVYSSCCLAPATGYDELDEFDVVHFLRVVSRVTRMKTCIFIVPSDTSSKKKKKVGMKKIVSSPWVERVSWWNYSYLMLRAQSTSYPIIFSKFGLPCYVCLGWAGDSGTT